MNIRTIALAALAGLAGPVHAAGLDVTLSDDAARFEYRTLFSGFGLSDADLALGITYNDDDDWLASARLEVFGDAAPGQGLRAGAAVGAFVGDVADGDIIGIGLGAGARYAIPGADRFAVSGRIFFAPDITSFGDSEGYTDWQIQGEYELTRSSRLYGGYRNIEVDIENRGDVELDKGLYFGVSLDF